MLTSMARLPLQTLPAFRAVARTANLRAAAEELHLTHSAVSQQIKLLEEQLGFELFDRRGRRVALNAAGEALLRAVEPALAGLDEGIRAAAAASEAGEQTLRITLLQSFAQRWLLPRIARWRAQHPGIGIELSASQHLVELRREGFHAALRQGDGQWKGLVAECLTDSPLVVLGSPQAARRLLGCDAKALADEPLLGHTPLWQQWFALSGLRPRVNPVASFSDAGLMLQAAEQNIGLTLAREILAADALRDGRLVRLSSISMRYSNDDAYWLTYPPELAEWPPLVALREWLLAELDRSQRELDDASQRTLAMLEAAERAATSSSPGAARATRSRRSGSR
jgi:LysR family glycine cleavage system transcriptional activator